MIQVNGSGCRAATVGKKTGLEALMTRNGKRNIHTVVLLEEYSFE